MKNQPRLSFLKALKGYGIFILAGLALLGGQPPLAQSAQRQQLAHHLTASFFSAPRAGEMTGEEKIFLSLGLSPRDPQGLEDFLAKVTDPRSPEYGHYLKKGEFADKFGPTAEDYRKVEDFAKANGLTVVNTHSGRTMVYVTGTSAQVQKTFHVHLRYYRRKDKTRFFAPDEQPSVDLDVPLSYIGGLDNYFLPKHARPAKPAKRGQSPVESPQAGPQNWGTGPGDSFWGNDYRKAYAPNVSLNGAGQTVAVMEDSGFTASDIQQYETVSGLGSSVPVSAVLIDGADGSVQPSWAPPYDNTSPEEVSMDIELLIAMAPGLSEVMVYQGNPYSAPNGLGQNVYSDDLMAAVADDDEASIISCSLSFFAETTTAFILQQMAAQGQSFFVSSGDSGAYFSKYCNPICHSIQDETYITSVGATALTTNADGTWASETGDSISGGGYSSDLPLPNFQQGAINGTNMGSTTARNFPDVAANGNINNFVVYTDITGPNPVPGQSAPIGGTSAACPLWAGFMALVNQQRALSNLPSIGFADPALYAIGKGLQYHSDFHDITSGNNSNGTVSYNAVANYDLVTGWGSPAGQSLIDDLCPGCKPAPTSTPAPPASPSPTKAITPGPTGAPFETRTPTVTPSPTLTLTCVPSGASWKEITKKAAFVGRADFASVTFNGRMWIFGGETLNPGGTVYDTTADDAWSSADGASWKQTTTDAGIGHRMSSKLAVFDPGDGKGPRMYLYGGFDPFSTPPNKVYNDLYTSFDGVTWKKVPVAQPFPAVRIAPVLIAFNGRLWMAGGGNMDDEWSSADGVHWVQNMAHIQALGNGFHSSPNGPTQDFAGVSDAVVLNGQIWAMSPSNSSPNPNCLFYTPDGYTWTYVASGNFQNRDNFAFFAYAGKLWIAGGSKGTQRFNDVWDVDTASAWNWQSATMSAPFSARGLFDGGLVFQDQMWILGGALAPAKPGGATGFGNDVWETQCK